MRFLFPRIACASESKSSPFPLTAALLCLISGIAFAQQSTVQGLVTDSSGAAAPGAVVTITNVGTRATQTTQSNSTGFYTVPFLPPGTYSIRAELSGFAPQTRNNVKVDVNAIVRTDFKLEVGAVEQAISVSAAAALLNTETTSVGQVIDNTRVVELPLNGRNYLQLAQLTNGVAPTSGSRTESKGSFSALGARAYQMNVLLDGVDNNSRAEGGQLGYEAQAVTPSVDAVQEFKVVTNNNSAEYGYRMGGTVVVQTKSGGNEFHGSAYEFLRNDVTAANNFFANKAGQPRGIYKRNQFGGTLGGRIIKDRTFFFGSYEGTRERVGRNFTSTVPTPARLSGVFTDSDARPIYDPATTRNVAGRWVRDLFPNATVPSSRFDPIVKQVLGWYPTPNQPGNVNNYFFAPSAASDTDQYDFRLDHTLSNAHRAFFRYSRRDLRNLDPGSLPLPGDGGQWQTASVLGNSYVGNLTSVLSTSMSNEFRFGLTTADSLLDFPWDYNYNEQLGIKGIPPMGKANDHGGVLFAISGYRSLGSRAFWPNDNDMKVYHLADHLTRVQGRHLLKMGVEYRQEAGLRNAGRYARGQMSFNADFSQDPNNRARTGDALVDFLLGSASGGNFGSTSGIAPRTKNLSFYFQDDWKFNNRLTLNLGLRWDRLGRTSFANLDEFPVGRFVLGPPGTTDFTLLRPKNSRDNGTQEDNNNFAPRIGIAYQATRSTVVRTGYGLFFAVADSAAQVAAWDNGPPDFSEFTFPTDRLVQPALVVSNGFPPGLLPATQVQRNVAIRNVAVDVWPSQYSHQWFFDLQQQIPFDAVVTISYLGTTTRQMVGNRNLNAVTQPGPGTIVARRPYPFFSSITVRHPGFNANYNAFAAKAEKRFSKGLTFLAAYTWSHNIDDGAGTLEDGVGTFRNSNEIRWDRANSEYDRRHNFVGSFVYDLPFGKGRTYGAGWNSLTNALLGGWQIGAILSLRTGEYYSATVSGDPNNAEGTDYADRIRDGNLSGGERTIDRWFDVSAFQVPVGYVWGNAGRNILLGPRDFSLDTKFGKNFYFAEKYRLEFRAEMFNFTNTPSFGLPASVINNPGVGTITSASAPRRIQFALKLVF